MIRDTEKAETLPTGWDGNTPLEIGKTDNGIVVVTTHLYDGTKSLPLDLELYQHATSLPCGKKAVQCGLGGFPHEQLHQEDPAFQKKPKLALFLIERTLERKYRPGIV